MLGPPSSAAVAGLYALVLGGLLFAFGYLLSGLVADRLRLDPLTRAALAFPCLVAFALVLMVVHVATRGWLLNNPVAARAATLLGLGLAVLVRRRSRRDRPHQTGQTRRDLLLAMGLAAAACLVWGFPIFRLLPLAPTIDIKLHVGWAAQLLNGEPTPSAPVTGEVPNYYPWMYHALVAWIARLSSGGNAFYALGPLQLLHVAGSVLGLFAAGRALGRNTMSGASSALFGALTGGVGFVLVRGFDLASRARASEPMTYMGDLLSDRSYNLAMHNLAAPHPRDVAFALIASCLLLLVIAAESQRLSLLAGAGVLVGLIGLTGAETWLFALLTATATAVVVFPTRLRALAFVVVPALTVHALWLVPLIVTHVRLGGFVDTTRLPPLNLPVHGVLGAWGVVTPFALGGTYLALRARARPAFRVLLVITAVGAMLVLGSPWLSEVLGEGFSTLERRHRYWPLLYLAASLAGGVGAGALYELLGRRKRSVAIALAGAVAAVALTSPVIASVALTRIYDPETYKMASALTGGETTVLNELAAAGNRRCVAAVPAALSRRVFAFTGYRLVDWRGGATGENSARIRWRRIYERIPDGFERARDNSVLLTGDPPYLWSQNVDQYDVDLIATGASNTGAPAFSGYSSTRARSGNDSFLVLRVGECDS